MSEFFSVLDQHFKVFMMLGVGAIFVLGSICRTFAQIHHHAARERSRREVAAYVAEGTMTPEEGERLLKADVRGTRLHAC